MTEFDSNFGQIFQFLPKTAFDPRSNKLKTYVVI